MEYKFRSKYQKIAKNYFLFSEETKRKKYSFLEETKLEDSGLKYFKSVMNWAFSSFADSNSADSLANFINTLLISGRAFNRVEYLLHSVLQGRQTSFL